MHRAQRKMDYRCRFFVKHPVGQAHIYLGRKQKTHSIFAVNRRFAELNKGGKYLVFLNGENGGSFGEQNDLEEVFSSDCQMLTDTESFIMGNACKSLKLQLVNAASILLHGIMLLGGALELKC